jgi:cell fate (sporulation/competence/biofilm development) regulator YlbF (YheA/YmcA/DUF963 family)
MSRLWQIFYLKVCVFNDEYFKVFLRWCQLKFDETQTIFDYDYSKIMFKRFNTNISSFTILETFDYSYDEILCKKVRMITEHIHKLDGVLPFLSEDD